MPGSIKVHILLALLTPAIAQGEPAYETVVTAPVTPHEDNAASASVITAERTPRSAESVPQLLSELPGVTVTRWGGLGAPATLSIRGSATNQVLVYLDGVPLNTATWGAVDLALVPMSGFERIEVYRGQSPIAFGASALGGIVSVVSRVPHASGASAQAGGGSFGTRFAGAEATWAGTRMRVLGSVNHLASTGDFPYANDRGTAFVPGDDTTTRRQNNELAQTDALLRGALSLPGRRELFGSISFLDREQGLPTLGIYDSYEAALGTRRWLGTLRYDAHDDLGTGGRLRATTYVSDTEQRLHEPLPEVGYAPAETRDRTTAVGSTVTGGGFLTSWFRLNGVLDGRYETFQPHDDLQDTPSGPPATRLFGAAGIEPHFTIARLEIIPSVRFEAAHDEVFDRDLFGQASGDVEPRTYAEPILRLSVTAQALPWLDLRANGGRYARLPTTFERYGNNGRVMGNPTLVPEWGWNADLGGTVTLGASEGTGLTVDGAIFGSRVHDLIDWQSGVRTSRARNVDEARVLGVELSTDARLGRHARLVAQGTYTDARDASEIAARRDKQLPNRPRVRAYGRPELRRLAIGGGWHAGVYGDCDVTGGNYLDPANVISVPARVLFGAGAHIESPSATWRLVVSAFNLADAQVTDLLNYPLPGRSLFFTLAWHSPTKETVQ